MSEKVLGFKEKDDLYYFKTHFDDKDWWFRKTDKIPVVSLEWMKSQKCLTEKTRPLSDEKLNAYLQGKLDFYYDLIEAARKQAGEK